MRLHAKLLEQLPCHWQQMIERGATLTIHRDRVSLNFPDIVRFTCEPTAESMTPDNDARVPHRTS